MNENAINEKINKYFFYNHNKLSDSKFSIKASGVLLNRESPKPIKLFEL